jgi:hypothetical protein
LKTIQNFFSQNWDFGLKINHLATLHKPLFADANLKSFVSKRNSPTFSGQEFSVKFTQNVFRRVQTLQPVAVPPKKLRSKPPFSKSVLCRKTGKNRFQLLILSSKYCRHCDHIGRNLGEHFCIVGIVVVVVVVVVVLYFFIIFIS